MTPDSESPKHYTAYFLKDHLINLGKLYVTVTKQPCPLPKKKKSTQ